jgi:trehalose 6-phosphate phosphatase
LPATTVVLISGRSRSGLAALPGIPDTLHLIGSHGAEFETGFGVEIDTALLGTIKRSLLRIAAAHPGVTVEAKPASLALHVRNAAPQAARAALEAARAASAEWPAEMTEGKAVLEFAVITTDKGHAIDIMRARVDASVVVYFGDDVTDEKAFRRLCADSDVGVKIGPGETLAQYRVSSPPDVAEALVLLLRERCHCV